ncbi:urokinase plasminogen activator surface receptor-like [Clinocottus analis]|uniref:urokinase plasminogen activator surface receptor-like n=1 Tax=Clinocottus analis TaxID=304258 RepID=UPI0035BEF838
MHLLTLILGITLLPRAHTLNCYECVPGTSGACTDTAKECPLSGQLCGALRMTSYAGGSKVVDINSKSCALKAECIEASVNFGISKTKINTNCCNSNLCNVKPAPEASESAPNGKKCFQCKGQDCTATLNCEGTEDHCISTTMNIGSESMTIKGCASKLICLPETQQMSGIMGAKVNCCQGDYCNSASSTSAGLLLLVAPLVSVVVLS